MKRIIAKSLSLFSQVIFEAEVSDSKAGFIAIDDIQVLSYPCGESLACQQLVLVGWIDADSLGH